MKRGYVSSIYVLYNISLSRREINLPGLALCATFVILPRRKCIVLAKKCELCDFISLVLCFSQMLSIYLVFCHCSTYIWFAKGVIIICNTITENSQVHCQVLWGVESVLCLFVSFSLIFDEYPWIFTLLQWKLHNQPGMHTTTRVMSHLGISDPPPVS